MESSDQILITILVAVVAPVFTIIGVLLANWNSRVQNRESLKHDSDQRDREREMTLRRDIYMETVDAISRQQNLLTQIIDLDISGQEFDKKYNRNYVAVGKIQIIATNETVQATSSFMIEVQKAFTEIFLERSILLERLKEIKSLEDVISESKKSKKKFLELMIQFNLDGNTDDKKWKVIENNYKFEEQQQEKFIKLREKLWIEQNKEHLQFAQLCYENYMKVSKLVPEIIFSIRDELELPLDKKEYLDLFEKGVEEEKENFEAFLKKLKGETS